MTERPRDASLAEILQDDLPDGQSEAGLSHWLARLDRWATRVGDAVNPILVKETRQALKSRQFVATFSLLLVAAFAWTVIGSMLQMPQIYYTPSAQRLLVGYYLVLAVPMLLVVPLAAYRSLEGEVDDGTLELLSITALSPRQVVTGKLASAALQMLLYFVALFPCVAYAYTLRGVDLPTLGLLMAMLVFAGLWLTIVALFFAPVSVGRTGQISSLLAVLSLLLCAEFVCGTFAMELIRQGVPLSGQELAAASLTILAVGGSAAAILLVATAAKLTPESENRSTGIRVAVLVHMACIIAVAASSTAGERDSATPLDQTLIVPMVLSVYLVGFWAVVGSMMAAESPAMTPRIRRELPGTFAGRLLWTWLTPGPATGLVFATATLTVAAAVVHLMLRQTHHSSGVVWYTGMVEAHGSVMLLVVAYLMFAWVGVRLIIGFLRTRGPVKVPVGMAAAAVILLLMSMGPYSIQLHLNDYRQFSYSAWQASNWMWTINQARSGALEPWILYLVVCGGGAAFLIHLLLVGQRVLPQRLATPERVQQEYRRLAGVDSVAAEENDPLGLGTEHASP